MKDNNEILSLQYIKGVGPKRAKAFEKEGFKSPKDLLTYFPVRYIDRSGIISIRELYNRLNSPSKIELSIDLNTNFNLSSEFTIVAKIIDKHERSFGRGRGMLALTVKDNSGTAKITFWNMINFFSRKYEHGMLLMVSGKAEIDKYNNLNFSHPEIEIIGPEDESNYIKGAILPKYKLSDTLVKAGITNRLMRQIVENILPEYIHITQETLPIEMLKEYDLPEVKKMIPDLHFPNDKDGLKKAKRRLKFEEIFYYLIPITLNKLKNNEQKQGHLIKPKSSRARKLYDELPFDLTKDQKKVLREIADDFENGKAMNRLLQGDVGSGKTIVAVLSILMAVDSGFQTAFMAPTEILAEQHFHNIKKFVEPLDIKVVQLVGGQNKRMRELIKHEISEGNADIIVGTHAMFQSDIEYKNLAYVIIDEQHRFGVAQRGDLIDLAKKSYENQIIFPHILVMTATPIPRTLTMTAYGDLDVSTIKTKPKNRKPIKTTIAFDSNRDDVFDFIKDRVNKGEQAFIVYPLVEKSEKLELKSAVEHYESLKENVFQDYNCGLIHGQMLWYEKEDAMKAFLEKEYDILISTTVIEVGIDIPNASVMVVEHAERFGLSQLHQLRGRVGRGKQESYCILMSPDHFKFQLKKTKDPEKEKTAAIARLKIMEKTNDGFQIAEFDMKLRGPGDVLGTKQAGLPDFKYVDLVQDTDIIGLAKKAAENMLNIDPELSMKKHKIIRNTYKTIYDGKIYFEIA